MAFIVDAPIVVFWSMQSSQLANYACRYVIQEIIKDMARNRSVESKKRIKVLVLHEVDSLSKQAQHSLRRTMEKYSSVCRLVMLCSTVSKVLEPVRSRCLCVRVPAPEDAKVMDVLMHVSREETLNLPPTLAARIVAASGRDVRKALLCLECCKVQQFPFAENQQPRLADWELYIMVRLCCLYRCFRGCAALEQVYMHGVCVCVYGISPAVAHMG